MGRYPTNKIIVRNVSASTSGQELLGWTAVPDHIAGSYYRLVFWISICVPTTGVAGAATQQCRVTYSSENVNSLNNGGSCVPFRSFQLNAHGAFTSITAEQGKINIASSVSGYHVASFRVDTSGSTGQLCSNSNMMTPSSAYTIWYGSY